MIQRYSLYISEDDTEIQFKISKYDLLQRYSLEISKYGTKIQFRDKKRWYRDISKNYKEKIKSTFFSPIFPICSEVPNLYFDKVKNPCLNIK